MNKNDERTAKYLKVFNTPQGKWVLEDLKKRFSSHYGLGDGTVDGVALALMLAGQRGEASVIRYIERQLEKGN